MQVLDGPLRRVAGCQHPGGREARVGESDNVHGVSG